MEFHSPSVLSTESARALLRVWNLLKARCSQSNQMKSNQMKFLDTFDIKGRKIIGCLVLLLAVDCCLESKPICSRPCRPRCHPWLVWLATNSKVRLVDWDRRGLENRLGMPWGSTVQQLGRAPAGSRSALHFFDNIQHHTSHFKSYQTISHHITSIYLCDLQVL